MEAELRGTLPVGLRWNTSYAYETIQDRLAINQTGLYSPQDYQRGTPSHVVVLGGGYTSHSTQAGAPPVERRIFLTLSTVFK